MRKLVVSEFLSLDGVMDSPEKWQFPYISDDVAADIQERILAEDALLLGRVTYEVFAGYWPLQTNNEFGIADQLNRVPKYVVSTTLDKADWNNSTIIRDNLAEEINKLKQQPGGDISVTGSATLIRSLMEADLIDEYHLQIYPVVLGSGIRLFPEGQSQNLKLIEAKPYQSGAVLMRYQRDGKAAN